MASEVEVCNLALSNIRAGSINSLSEASLQAQQCSLKYPIVRDMLLATNIWGFARKLVALTLTTTEIFNWAYAYQYPSDCLKINRLVGQQEYLAATTSSVINRFYDTNLLPITNIRRRVSYEIFNFSGNRLIGTDESELYIEYVMKVTDPNLFPVTFQLALSHLLAAEVAIPIIGAETGRKLRSDSLTMYKEYISQATAEDMNETDKDDQLSEFETVRR